MAKKVQKKEIKECTNMKFYVVSLVVIVGIVLIFALYITSNYSGYATNGMKEPGANCFIDNDLCEWGCQVSVGESRNGICRGAPLGATCSDDRNCQDTYCGKGSGGDWTCGGKTAFCRDNTQCASGVCLMNYKTNEGRILNNKCA